MHRLLPLLLLAACWPPPLDTGEPVDWSEDQLSTLEVELRDQMTSTPIGLAGTVVTPEGAPVAGATVTAGDQAALTDDGGAFLLEALPRHNVLVEVDAEGYRPHLLPAWLYRPLGVDQVRLDPVPLTPADAAVARFLFAGDVAFGRRFMDPDESTPWDEMPPPDPEALISTDDAEADTRAVLEEVRPWFQAVDVGVVNLESVVTEHPDTPHPTKDFVYFTLPGSLAALDWLGVDYLSLGNNHTYDYLEPGVVDTLHHVAEAGLPHSGLGPAPDSAWEPVTLHAAGTDWGMVSATSSSGYQHPISYVAQDDKGGAADLRDDERLAATLQAERDAGRVPIAIWHTGKEYLYWPSDYAHRRLELGAEQGAALVVAHHPHIAMGFARHEGVPIAMGLGNLAFDQQRLETMQGLLAQADLRGDEVVGLQGIPVQIEAYRPRPVTGLLADALLRRLAGFSEGIEVVPWNDRMVADVASAPVDRVVTATVDIGSDGWGVIDLRDLREPRESLRAAAGPATARPGRDLLLHGTLEDLDVDGDAMEVAHWDVSSGSRFACLSGARSGAVGLCSVRYHANDDDSVIAFRNRVRVWGDALEQPVKDLTLLGWARGDDAGPLRVVARYHASEGDRTFGEQDAWVHPGGTFDWRRFAADLDMPADVDPGDREANPRAVRLFLRHGPPSDVREARVAWDDLALISWEETVDLTGGAVFDTPHARDFLRVEAPSGPVEIELTFRRRVRFE